MTIKTPQDQIKETCVNLTKGVVSKFGIDNPELLCSNLRKEVTRVAMIKYAQYVSSSVSSNHEGQKSITNLLENKLDPSKKGY